MIAERCEHWGLPGDCHINGSGQIGPDTKHSGIDLTQLIRVEGGEWGMGVVGGWGYTLVGLYDVSQHGYYY